MSIKLVLHLDSQLPCVETGCVTDFIELCFSQVFPSGLPEEFTLIFTLALKKNALRDNIYLFQISDEQGYPQVPLTFSYLTACTFFTPLCHFTLCSSFNTTFVNSSFFSLISLLHSRPLPPSISSLRWHLLNSFSLFIPCAFCPHLFFSRSLSLSSPALCQSTRSCGASLLSLTFIVIHVCSMMKNLSLPESP